MAKYMAWQQYIQNDLGAVIPSASIEVRDEDTGALATLYATQTGGSLGNPFTAGIDGLARFYAADGSYKITATSGADVSIYRHVPIGMSQYVDIGTDPDQVPLAGNVLPVVEDDASTARVLVDDDAFRRIRFTSGSAVTVSLGAGVLAARQRIHFFREGAGTVTFSIDSTVTVHAKALAISPRYGWAVLECIGMDEYDLYGDLA